MAESLMVKVAGNLRAITTLHERLLTEAVHCANDPLMPGGKAMVSLAHVASLQQWSWQVDYLERVLDHHPDIAEDDDWEPPLQTLLFWSEQWRVAHDMELTDRRATISSEANFLRWCLEWAWDNEVHFEDFARDVAAARRRVEDTLREGERAERTRVECDRCELPPRLIRVYADSADPDEDTWKCPKCKHVFDDDDRRRAHAKQLRTDGARRFVQLADAVDTLKSQGRSEHTTRKWLEECRVTGYCEVVTHKVWVWWPDLWVLHLTTPTRKRTAA